MRSQRVIETEPSGPLFSRIRSDRLQLVVLRSVPRCCSIRASTLKPALSDLELENQVHFEPEFPSRRRPGSGAIRKHRPQQQIDGNQWRKTPDAIRRLNGRARLAGLRSESSLLYIVS